MNLKDIFDLAIAIDCDDDWDFVNLLESAAQNLSLKTYIIWPENHNETYHQLSSQRLFFRFIYDRASDTTGDFMKIYDWVIKHGGASIEKWDIINWASDKATMHLEFIASGIQTPYTIILPPYEKEKKITLTIEDLACLGRSFIIKPANTTGGGIGVIDGAETLQDILEKRQEFQRDKYLLQEKVIPLEMDNRRFWFRGFYTFGLIQCTWWNDLTHKYDIMYKEQIDSYNLATLYDLVGKIAQICKLNFFSTEIALDRNKQFMVVDYVNEICDMRLQSKHFDGVPDEIVQNIVFQIASFIRNSKNN